MGEPRLDLGKRDRYERSVVLPLHPFSLPSPPPPHHPFPFLLARLNYIPSKREEADADAAELRLTKDTELNNNLDNSAAAAPTSPRPKREPGRTCGDTPPEAPAFW